MTRVQLRILASALLCSAASAQVFDAAKRTVTWPNNMSVPYGPGTDRFVGDISGCGWGEKCYSAINLSVPFKFFGSSFDKAFPAVDGYISLGSTGV